MLSYKNFKIRVKEEITKLLEDRYEDFKGWTLVDSTRYSINRKIDFMELHPPGDKMDQNTVLPSFRYLPMYTAYTSGLPVAGIAEDVTESMVRNLVVPIYSQDQPVYASQVLDPDNIYISLIGKDLNKELLETIPHVDFLDLAVIFRAIVQMDHEGEYSAIVNYDMLKDLGKTADELLSIASANSMRDFPPVAEERDESYCITAQSGSICSHALVCDQLLYDTACQAGCNLYIVPITLKFSVAFPETSFSGSELSGTSRRMSARLRDEDKLSDKLYYYDRMAHQLSLYA